MNYKLIWKLIIALIKKQKLYFAQTYDKNKNEMSFYLQGEPIGKLKMGRNLFELSGGFSSWTLEAWLPLEEDYGDTISFYKTFRSGTSNHHV